MKNADMARRGDWILDRLLEKGYPDILTMNDGSAVTAENWRARREELRELLERYSYGRTPREVPAVKGEVIREGNKRAYAGKVLEQEIRLTLEGERGSVSFPIQLFIPRKVSRPPVFLHLAFRPVPDMYIPVEEITDRGYAIAVLCYGDVVNDNHYGDYSDGLAAYFGTTPDRAPDEWGKIGMWAFGASRVLDYILAERADLDGSRVCVIGHSRLGKTALWCAAQDERFFAVASNDSGYGGAASSKKGSGERVRSFLRFGSWDWFCENFKEFADEKEDEKPYDQSFLLAMIAPRYLMVGSAKEDAGADPEAELLTTLHASSVWELLGKRGLVTGEEMPDENTTLHAGDVGYHLRSGQHFLSRQDWNYYMDFLDGKLGRA